MFSLSKLTPVIDDTPVFIMVHLKVVERWAGLQGSIKVLIILHGATFRTGEMIWWTVEGPEPPFASGCWVWWVLMLTTGLVKLFSPSS